jgi:hypothetical protein
MNFTVDQTNLLFSNLGPITEKPAFSQPALTARRAARDRLVIKKDNCGPAAESCQMQVVQTEPRRDLTPQLLNGSPPVPLVKAEPK